MQKRAEILSEEEQTDIIAIVIGDVLEEAKAEFFRDPIQGQGLVDFINKLTATQANRLGYLYVFIYLFLNKNI